MFRQKNHVIGEIVRHGGGVRESVDFRTYAEREAGLKFGLSD